MLDLVERIGKYEIVKECHDARYAGVFGRAAAARLLRPRPELCCHV